MMVLRRVGAGHIFNLILIGSAWQVMHCAIEKTDFMLKKNFRSMIATQNIIFRHFTESKNKNFPSTGEVLWYNSGY